MSSMIVPCKFKCKAGSKITDRGAIGPWIDNFIEGKWYDGEYETWSFENGYILNGGFRRYWVTNESGVKQEISKAYMNAIFYLNKDDIRNEIIDDIIGN